MAKDNMPHVAQMEIHLKIYARRNDGSIDAVPLTYEEMQLHGLRDQTLVEVSGFDKFETIKKVHEAINGIKR